MRFRVNQERYLTQSSRYIYIYIYTLEAQLPIYWVPVLGSLYKLILPITQEPTVWVPGLLGIYIYIYICLNVSYPAGLTRQSVRVFSFTGGAADPAAGQNAARGQAQGACELC